MSCGENGQQLYATYNIIELLGSFLTSIVGAWCAVQVAEAYRVEKNQTTRRWLLLWFGIVLGAVSIWMMHFQAMLAKKLHCPNGVMVEQIYNVPLTLVSYVSAIIVVSIGATIASYDVFFGRSTAENLSRVVELVEKRASKNQPTSTVSSLVLFEKPKHILGGGFVAGTGVVVMHYSGMAAMVRTGFRVEWAAGLIVVSYVVAVSVATVGFWIVFRLLQWKPHVERLRFIVAIVIGFAVCSAHYTGDRAVTYYVDSSAGTSEALLRWSVDMTTLVSLATLVNPLLVLFAQMYVIINYRRSTRNQIKTILDEVATAIEKDVLSAPDFGTAKRNIRDNILGKALTKSKTNLATVLLSTHKSVNSGVASGVFSFAGSAWGETDDRGTGAPGTKPERKTTVKAPSHSFNILKGPGSSRNIVHPLIRPAQRTDTDDKLPDRATISQ